MNYPYRQTERLCYEPIVPLYMKTAHEWITMTAFIDTGADFSVFHADIANILGLKLEHGKKLSVMVGDGNHMAVYWHPLPVRFANHVFVAEIGFSNSLGANFNLMGRKSFFEKFRFCFNDRDRVVSVTRL